MRSTFIIYIFYLAFILNITVFYNCNSNKTEEKKIIYCADLTHKSIAYILPSNVSSRYWNDKYGDRIFFYTVEDLENYRTDIDNDFKEISVYYNTVILFLPLDSGSLFKNNLKLINSIADKYDLFMFYNILPEVDFTPENTYLESGTKRNLELLSLMDFMTDLSQTWKTSVWYGWKDRADPKDVIDFYAQLPVKLKLRYACWLDEEFIMPLQGLNGMDFLIVTEWYQFDEIERISSMFSNQMLITGYEGAENKQDWLENIKELFKDICRPDLYIGLWIFYDKNDGHKEEYSAFFPSEEEKTGDPWQFLVK